MTCRGSLRTLFAVRAMPMAPSAAAKDSCPAKKQKHLVSSLSNIAPRFPCPRPTFLFCATDPGMQNACKPIPMASAASDAVFTPLVSAIATPSVYAQLAFSNAMGCTPLTILSTLMPLSRHSFCAASRSARPYSLRQALI